tara:strand:- start:178 stop:459 length:282 start_codon:yes stop_codon:yes gene_type:complete
MTIIVKHLSETRFEVTVTLKTTTIHTVNVSDKAHKKYTFQKITKEQFVKKSFLFLLQREPNTSILSDFDIELIEKFFPEFRNIGDLGWIDIGV